MSFVMVTPQDTAKHTTRQMQAKRLSLNFTQKALSERSGVSFGVIKKFERTGKISLESLLKIALALDSLEAFEYLFKERAPELAMSLDELLSDKKRKRARQ